MASWRVKFPWHSIQPPGLGSLIPWFGAREHSWEVYPICTSPVHLGFPALILGLWTDVASPRGLLHHDCSPEISPTAVHLNSQTQYSASQLLHILKSLSLRLHSGSCIPVALYSWCWSIIPTPLIPTQHPVTNCGTPHLLLSLAHRHIQIPTLLLQGANWESLAKLFMFGEQSQYLRFLTPYVVIMANCTSSISVAGPGAKLPGV